MHRAAAIALCSWSLFLGAARAVPPPLPTWGRAPLLFVRFGSPAGMKVTFYQGAPRGQTFDAPVVVGLRPGYVYRVKLSGFPGHPETILFPSLEVRGTLMLPCRFRSADYPAPVNFTEEDLRTVRAGGVVTKVLALEHPDRATPAGSRPGEPLEVQPPPDRDPVLEARDRGRLMLIVRLGQREFSPEEMDRQAVGGTMLLPGDHALYRPSCPPWIPWACAPVYDPLVGPKCPEEECLRDGGDHGNPVGFDREGRLTGLDPADAVAEYSDSTGRRRITVSNCVCVFVPRYVVIRAETLLAGVRMRVGPEDVAGVKREEGIRVRVPSVETNQAEGVRGLHARERLGAANNVVPVGRLSQIIVLHAFRMDIGPAALLGTRELVLLTEVQRVRLKRQMELPVELSRVYGLGLVGQTFPGPEVVGRVEGVKVIGTLQGPRSLTVCCNQAPVPPPVDRPLVLFKWADRQSAQVGDVVTFFLKYSNHGGRPIADVAVADSLTGRLEYIPGSAKADREAVFTLQENEAGSVILRWEITGRLLPGQSGVVSFQARIR